MAAGIGSRFGGGIKQLESVGANDEIIMDYSIHDAILAGFSTIIFVIRKDIEEDFKDRIGNRIEKICKSLNIETYYVFQDMYNIPEGYKVPMGRTKPWGTGQAVLAAKDILKEPFIVINADDYYGKDAFKYLNEWLKKEHKDSEICMAGYVLGNTLSENGGVTRGVCNIDKDNIHVKEINETSNIVKDEKLENAANADGKIIPLNSLVSMNMWAFPSKEGNCPDFIKVLDENFINFFKEKVPVNPLKSEYLLPILIGSLIEKKTHTVEVIKTEDKWFGVTYKEDKDKVILSIKKLIEDGMYNKDLYSDLLK